MLARAVQNTPALFLAGLQERAEMGQQALHHILGLANTNMLTKKQGADGWLWAVRWVLKHGANPNAPSGRGVPLAVLITSACGLRKDDAARSAVLGQAMEALMDAGAQPHGPQIKGESAACFLAHVRPEVVWPWLARWTRTPESLAWRESETRMGWPELLMHRLAKMRVQEDSPIWEALGQALQRAWVEPEFWTSGLGDGLLSGCRDVSQTHPLAQQWGTAAQAARLGMIVTQEEFEAHPASKRPRL